MAADAVLEDGVPAMTGLQPGQIAVGLVGDEALKAIAVVIGEAQLRARMRALTSADQSSSLRPGLQVDGVGQLGDRCAVAWLTWLR